MNQKHVLPGRIQPDLKLEKILKVGIFHLDLDPPTQFTLPDFTFSSESKFFEGNFILRTKDFHLYPTSFEYSFRKTKSIFKWTESVVVSCQLVISVGKIRCYGYLFGVIRQHIMCVVSGLKKIRSKKSAAERWNGRWKWRQVKENDVGRYYNFP